MNSNIKNKQNSPAEDLMEILTFSLVFGVCLVASLVYIDDKVKKKSLSNLQIEQLKQEQEAAIKLQDFERAAEIRDILKNHI